MGEENDISIEPSSASEIFPLRQAVLRPGFPLSAARFDADDDPATRHFAARSNSQVIACVTFHPSAWDGEPAWQLRGMAVHPEWRGSGTGSRLLQGCDRMLMAEGPIRLMWCNARSEAVGFYQRNGWRIVSEEFHLEPVGPHYRMIKRI
jgi:predicted GNAT family N-acyltransferase